MNQPSADTAPKGHVLFGRTSFTPSPSFYQENLNLAVGLASNFETEPQCQQRIQRAPTGGFPGGRVQVCALQGKHLTVYVGDQFIQPSLTSLRRVFPRQHQLRGRCSQRGELQVHWGSFQSHDGVALGNRAGAIGGIEWMAKMFKNGWSIMPSIDYASGAGMNGYASQG